VSDSTKFERSAPVRIAHISQIQTFVTDPGIPPRFRTLCHERGIAVIEAGPKGADDPDETAVESAEVISAS
jgi:DeoR family glycerol-3-phosphate regulon repressor